MPLAGCALVLLTFNPRSVVEPIYHSVIVDNVGHTVDQVCAWVKVHGLSAGGVVVGSAQDLYSDILGEGLSQRMINMGQVLKTRNLQGVNTIIYTYGDDLSYGGCFKPLSVPGEAAIFGKTFKPVFITKSRLGVIYEAK